MGTIADKLEYLTGTKTSIADALVEKGQSVDPSDTFRSYADKVSAISGGGGGGSSAAAYASRSDGIGIALVPGMTDFYLHIKGIMSPDLTIDDFTVSDNVLNIEYYNETLVHVTTSSLTIDERVSITVAKSAYMYDRGDSVAWSVTVTNKLEDYFFNPFVGTYVVKDTYTDTGNWNFNTPVPIQCKPLGTASYFTYYGGQYPAASTWNINSDSYITPSGGVAAYINHRDNSVNSALWHCFNTALNGDVLKIRFEGNAPYGNGKNMIYELYMLQNQDVILLWELMGSDQSGTKSVFGKAFEMPTVKYTSLVFYSKDVVQSDFDIVNELYNASHAASYPRPASASEPFKSTLATSLGTHDNLVCVLNNVKFDDNTFTLNVPNMPWQFSSVDATTMYINGNSWMGIGRSSEDVKVNRADAALYYVWVGQIAFTDINNLKAYKFVWRGASHYRVSVDQEWELYLFENGDAMIHCTEYTTARGSSSFLGVSFNVSAGSTTSFYRTNAEGTQWETDPNPYDITKHHTFD